MGTVLLDAEAMGEPVPELRARQARSERIRMEIRE